jgi:hypothetical protein
MIMNAKRSQQVICRGVKARGQLGSPLLELYTRSIFGGLNKKSTRTFCRLRRQTARWV